MDKLLRQFPNLAVAIQEQWMTNEHDRQPLLIDPYWTIGPQCFDVYIDGEKQSDVFAVDIVNHVVWEFPKDDVDLRYMLYKEPLPDDVQVIAGMTIRECKVDHLEVRMYLGNGYAVDIANASLVRRDVNGNPIA